MAAKHYTAACLLLSCFLASASAALLLSRPDGECLSPAATTTSFNLFPRDYQLTSIQSPSSSSSGFVTTVEFADDFSVQYRGTYKVVENKRANETYILYQCGTPNPMNSADTEVVVPANTKVFAIPLVSVAVADSAPAGLLAELGLIDRVAFSNEYSYNKCLQAINACGNTAVTPTEPFDYDTSPDNDAEFEATTVAAWRNASAAQNGQVDAIFTSQATANPKSIAVTAFADPGALNRAEWVKFVAVFFNKEVEAERLFSNISSNYEKLNSTARAAAGGAGKTVAWISKQGDIISMDYTAYKTDYMTDAGGVLIPAADLVAAGATEQQGLYSSIKYNFNASVPAQKAAFVEQISKADIIFDDSYAPESSHLANLTAFQQLYGLTDAAAAGIPAVAAGQVYAFNNRLGRPDANALPSNDWFEGSLARPDLVLADFVKVITPAAAPANAPTTWLRQLSSPRQLTYTTAADCSTIQTAQNAADRCERAEPARICPNAYRDCTTGELMTVTDPNQRCQAVTVCPDASASSGSNAQKPAGNAAAHATLSKLLLAFVGIALLACAL